MKLGQALLGRCPLCDRGSVFTPGLAGLVGAMNETCPNCGVRLLGKSEHFIGAMYVSYGLSLVTVLPLAVFLALVLQWSVAIVLVISLLQTLISVPLFLRYSRVIWLYLDQGR